MCRAKKNYENVKKYLIKAYSYIAKKKKFPVPEKYLKCLENIVHTY